MRWFTKNRRTTSTTTTKKRKKEVCEKRNQQKKYEARGGLSADSYFCKECGHNPTHSTVNCYILKNRAKREQGNGEGKAHTKPYSKRTFRKEVNSMARKAAKNGSLELYASALKRERAKIDKKIKKSKKKVAAHKSEDSNESSSDESMNHMEAPIPRKRKVNFVAEDKPDCMMEEEDMSPPKKKNIKQLKKLLAEQRKEIAKLKRKNKVFESDSDSEDENEASAEERAFLLSIDKEEKKTAAEAAEMSEETD